jgi:hypothetical protein
MSYSHDDLTVHFELAKEGAEVLSYREIHPRGVCKMMYISRLAAHFQWNGDVPRKLTITITPVPE